MAWIIKNEHEEQFINQLKSYPDRVVAILGQIMVERRLEAAIKAQWVNDTKGLLFDQLFNPSGPIGSFRAKIWIGYAIRLYGQDAYNDLLIINKVRNDFAHELEIRDFQSQEIADKLKNLVLPERYPCRREVVIEYPVELWEYLKGHIVGCGIDQSEANMDQPRERYMRSVEILTGFLWHEEYFVTQPEMTARLPSRPRF